MRVSIDQDLCSGCGQCVIVAPEIFDQRESDGVAFTLRTPQGPGEEADAAYARDSCPARAISID